HAALRGRGFSLGNGHDISCILNSVSRIGYPDLSSPSPEMAGPPAVRRLFLSRFDRKIFRRKVPQRLMVSGAGSGGAIAFLPAKASPVAKRLSAALLHS
ncbi:MAG: hypothetical protein Q7T68_05160, partial [Sphingopyxis sp.]|nr:hypothetical protein [Sphingopyxis sp.]